MANKSNMLVIALIVSVVANIALLAAPAKRLPSIQNPPPQPAIWSINKGQLEGLMRALPEPRRKAIRQELDSEFVQLRTITENLFRARDGLKPLLAQPQLDQAAVEKQLNDIREAQNASSTQAQKLILAVLSKLSAEERVAALTPRRPGQRPQQARKGPQQQQKPGKPAQAPAR